MRHVRVTFLCASNRKHGGTLVSRVSTSEPGSLRDIMRVTAVAKHELGAEPCEARKYCGHSLKIILLQMSLSVGKGNVRDESGSEGQSFCLMWLQLFWFKCIF